MTGDECTMLMRHLPARTDMPGVSMTHPRQVPCCRSHWPRQATRRLWADSTACVFFNYEERRPPGQITLLVPPIAALVTLSGSRRAP